MFFYSPLRCLCLYSLLCLVFNFLCLLYHFLFSTIVIFFSPSAPSLFSNSLKHYQRSYSRSPLIISLSIFFVPFSSFMAVLTLINRQHVHRSTNFCPLKPVQHVQLEKKIGGRQANVCLPSCLSVCPSVSWCVGGYSNNARGNLHE